MPESRKCEYIDWDLVDQYERGEIDELPFGTDISKTNGAPVEAITTEKRTHVGSLLETGPSQNYSRGQFAAGSFFSDFDPDEQSPSRIPF